MIFLFKTWLDVGVDPQTLLMRKRYRFQLSRDEFIESMKSALDSPTVWTRGCAEHGKTAFISEVKKISLSFCLHIIPPLHDHMECLRCKTCIMDPDRPVNCNTVLKEMLPFCSLNISVPWATGVTTYSEPLYDPSADEDTTFEVDNISSSSVSSSASSPS